MEHKVELLRVGQAAARLGIGPHRLRQLSDRGDVPAIWGPYGRMFRASDVEEYRERRERKAVKGGQR